MRNTGLPAVESRLAKGADRHVLRIADLSHAGILCVEIDARSGPRRLVFHWQPDADAVGGCTSEPTTDGVVDWQREDWLHLLRRANPDHPAFACTAHRDERRPISIYANQIDACPATPDFFIGCGQVDTQQLILPALVVNPKAG